MTIARFTIDIPQARLDDLHRRLENIRWPAEPGGTNWNKGVPADFLQPLIAYWQKEYDWRTQETALNQFDHYRSEIDGYHIHFIHMRGQGPSPLPLILTHGWPDSFLRYLKVIPYLTDPARFGGDPADAFDVIIPSVPGFGFSSAPQTAGLNNARVARLWFELMHHTLGYTRFAAAGGDLGSGITRFLAALYPQQVAAIHLTDVGILRDLMMHSQPEALTEEERLYRQTAARWINEEGGYMAIQATKPHTLAWGLNDSPVGLAAWIGEKFRAWSDCGGDLFSRFSRDEVLTNIMLYWLTESAGSAASIYYENTHSLPQLPKIKVPTGVACFPADILLPPRSWAEKNYPISHWREMPAGGHFTAMEEPEHYAADIRAFFRSYRHAEQ